MLYDVKRIPTLFFLLHLHFPLAFCRKYIPNDASSFSQSHSQLGISVFPVDISPTSIYEISAIKAPQKSMNNQHMRNQSQHHLHINIYIYMLGFKRAHLKMYGHHFSRYEAVSDLHLWKQGRLASSWGTKPRKVELNQGQNLHLKPGDLPLKTS